jgi:hypothetical protein
MRKTADAIDIAAETREQVRLSLRALARGLPRHPEDPPFSLSQALRLFLRNTIDGANIVHVSPTREIATQRLKSAFAAINAEQLGWRYLTSLTPAFIVDRETRARLRFAVAEVEDLAGAEPTEIVLEEALMGYQRKLVASMWRLRGLEA